MRKIIMAIQTQPLTRAGRMAQQRLVLRQQLWPDVTESVLWNRKKETGFVVIPRTLPLIIQIADSLTKNTPVGSTYLDLWSRVFDEGFVKLDKPSEQALASGFSTRRGPSIWASRLDLLEKEGFIRLAAGPNGPRSFALILNPYLVIQNRRKDINDSLYNTFMGQALAIGSQAGIAFQTTPTALPLPSSQARSDAPTPNASIRSARRPRSKPARGGTAA